MNRIALFSHSGYLNGAEVMLLNLALGLKKNSKFEPIVIIPKISGNELKNSCIRLGIETHSVEIYPFYIFQSNRGNQTASLNTLDAIKSIAGKMKELEIDIVLSNTLVSIVSIIAAVESQIPVISWVHGVLDPISGRELSNDISYERQLFFDRMVLNLSDENIFCSKWTHRYYKKYCVNSGTTINNWTSVESTEKLSKENNTFVCLNTFDKYKGVASLILAAKILKDKNLKFKVDLYGGGSSESIEMLNKLIIEQDLEEYVTLKGRIIETSDVYKNSLCLVQPSYLESFGMTVIEAMAHSRPVIAYKSGGPEETIDDNVTGYLVNSNDVGQMALKMQILLENRSKAAKMGRAGYKKFRSNYSQENSVVQFERVIEKTLKNELERNANKELLLDSIFKILELESIEGKIETPECVNLIVDVTNEPIQVDTIIPSDIFFSRTISSIKTYFLCSDIEVISNIGIIFASGGDVYGNVKIEVKINGRILRECGLDFVEIRQNDWTYFQIEPILGTRNSEIEIRLIFNYENNSSEIGVFQNLDKNSFKNRFLNKIGTDSNIVNLLCVDLK